MATAAAPQTARHRGAARAQVETTIRFVDPGDFVTRRYVRAGAEINTGTYSDHRVIVRDAMPIRDHFELDVHGFRIARAADRGDATSTTRPRSTGSTSARSSEHVRQLTGADKVVARGWMVRTSADLSERGAGEDRELPALGRHPAAGGRGARRPQHRRPRSAWPSSPTRSISPTGRASSAS